MNLSDSPNLTIDDFTLFFGDANPAEARVYVRWNHPPDDETYRLQGTVVGPHCDYARTLTSTMPLLQQPGTSDPLAQALLPDPCFWTPREPYLYEVRIEIRRQGEVVAQVEHPFGIRRLGVHRGDLILDGKKWNVRGVRAAAVRQVDLDAFHQSATALVVDHPEDDLCREAGQRGVLLIARLSGGANPIRANLHRLARWTAVGLVVLDTAEPLGDDLRSLAPNLLLARPADHTSPAPWADLALALEPFDTSHASLPRLVARWTQPQPDVDAARAECDRLQRDVAGRAAVVGYLV